MDTNTAIARGMERMLACKEGARLEGMFGLSGLGTVGDFDGLRRVLGEMGFAGADDHVRTLRQKHAHACSRVKAALPVAVAAARLVAADPSLGSLGKVKLSAAQKGAIAQARTDAKVAKITAKQAVTGNKLALKAAKVANKQAIASAKTATKVAKQLAKQGALQAKTAAALANAGVTPGMTPAEAGGAVLANQSGIPGLDPAFAQQMVSSAGGGGGAPAASMSAPTPEGAADDGLILGMTPLVAAGAGVGAAGVLYLLLKGGRRRG